MILLMLNIQLKWKKNLMILQKAKTIILMRLINFIKKFQPLLDEANEKMEVIAPKETGEKCPECGHDLVERHGRYGKFVACENYPECKYIKKEKVEPEYTGETCPKCGSPMVFKTGQLW